MERERRQSAEQYIDAELTANEPDTKVDALADLVIVMAQCMVMDLSGSSDPGNRACSANLMAAVLNCIRDFHGENAMAKVADVYTEGLYSKVGEMKDAGLTSEQALDFLEKKGGFDA